MKLNDPSLPSLNPSATSPQPCCVELRCKSMSYRPDERPGRLHWSDTQTYWCRLTMDPAGPDDAAANPMACQPGRACYRSEE